MANTREIVLSILMEYDRGGVRNPSLLKDSLAKYDYLETRDKSFIKRLTEGVIERQIQLDYVLDLFSRVGTKKMQPFIRSLLRMSVYQILFMDQVPDSAACDEAVKLARRHKFESLSGFVNGVLRNIARNKDSIEYPDRDKDGGVTYLSVIYSMPEWICRMWVSRFGMEKTEDILKFFMEPRPTTVRLSGGTDVSGFEKRLKDIGVDVRKSDLLPYALDLLRTDNIAFLPGFDEGEFFVQDVSSMLVTEIADPKPGDIVTDVCAAPGGKSLHAAERIKREDGDDLSGYIISRDVSERKCDLIRENADRMHISNIKIQKSDAGVHDQSLEGKADILYLDLPCSGLGIIGRKSDIKYNISPKSLKELSGLQWKIIRASWDYVKPGGILMYSTCTVNRAENEDMIAHICEELPFEPVDFLEKLPERLRNEDGNNASEDEELSLCLTSKKGYIQLLPGEFDTDGFFIAKLRRK
ncbi:MAG: 16S rRNA (cytosine(967)-C(5))-methyltransferase RsmB [Butyrivibrio sp.]|nr:16S rRNA (cytosine(967)-C(5))-methyltransferase RsmB [Butyrivibrio sp.]